MTNIEKLSRLKMILGKCGLEDSVLEEYLSLAEEEIVNYIYSMTGTSGVAVRLPKEYEQVQIWAVVYGINQRGAEGETNHIENGIERNFGFNDMVDYIHAHTVPYARVH